MASMAAGGDSKELEAMTAEGTPVEWLKYGGWKPEVHSYLKTVVRDTDVLDRLRTITAKELGHKSLMQISADQGQFMRFTAATMGAKKAIEVGTFTGYSALCVALGLPDDGTLIACDVSEEWANIGKPFWAEAGVDKKIDLRIAPATETLDALIAAGESGTFDFAFIDADKTSYMQYYERLLKLLRKGGVILIDNVLWSGKVADDSVTDADTVALRELNAFIVADKRVDMCMLSMADGISMVRKL